MITKTGTNSHTLHFEDNDEVYPCRCGQVHRGDYAIEDYLQHECFHDTALWQIEQDFVVCPECGKSWSTDAKQK